MGWREAGSFAVMVPGKGMALNFARIFANQNLRAFSRESGRKVQEA